MRREPERGRSSRKEFAGRAWRLVWLAAALIALAALPIAAQDELFPTVVPIFIRQITAERSGSVPTRDALRLRLVADAGNVSIFTDAFDEVRYHVVIQAVGDDSAVDSLRQFLLSAGSTPHGVSMAGALPVRSGLLRVQVSYEIHVPRHYDLDISTMAGDIVAQDIDGRVALSTAGGNIRIGHVGAVNLRPGQAATGGGFVARLRSGGGSIQAGDVAGALQAMTTGGRIIAGNVQGDAVLHTGGGHIQIGHVSGSAQLYSGGGDIVAASTGPGVTAETAGGRIEFGAADGAIRARTGGGGIRIARLSGPTDLSSGEGGISLTEIEAPLRVFTAAGPIVASLSPLFPNGAGVSELTSGQGDIVVYLPRKIALTIDAQIENGSAYRIVADPSLPLKLSRGSAALRGECAVNGGGEVLHLKTSAGNIELRFLDAATGQQIAAEQPGQQPFPPPNAPPIPIRDWPTSEQALITDAAKIAAGAVLTDGSEEDGFKESIESSPNPLAGLMRMFDQLWWGGVPVDPAAQQKRLIRPIPPQYPDVAREAGIEGDVALRVLIGRDGVVNGIDVLGGDPVLARAAMRAVEQWRYQPAILDGRPVNVVTIVTMAFRLR